MTHERRVTLLTGAAVIALAAAFVVGLSLLMLSIDGPPPTADQANTACRPHGGVARIEDGFAVDSTAICRDGFAADLDGGQ